MRTKQNLMDKLGFSFDRNSTHTARTIMLDEVTQLLDWVRDENATQQDYLDAIIENNCLQKRSMSNRKITARHLSNLYSLDYQIPIFKAFVFLWYRDEVSRPLLAILMAYARDTLFRQVADQILQIVPNQIITRSNTEIWINDLEPGRFSEVTLRSAAKNINSSWTQSGHLDGKINKMRTAVQATSGAVAFAVFLAYLSGYRGIEIFHAPCMAILDTSEHELRGLAQEASQRGWIIFNHVGDVIEFRFPNFLTADERDLLIEQN